MDAKRRAILDQAIEVFADEGFHQTDVQVIADRAGVGKGTVYRYFGNKEDLFWATTSYVFDRMRRHMHQAMEGVDGTLAKVEAACLAYAGFFEIHPKLLEVFVQERAMFRGTCPEAHRREHERMIEQFTRLLEEGIAAGEIRAIDPRETVAILGDAVHGAVVNKCYLPDGPDLVERTRRMIDIFFQGIQHRASEDHREAHS